jgi:hypothetical protein
MYCENLSQRFGDSLVGTWCDENVQGEKLAPGLDGFGASYQVKQEGVATLSGSKTIIAWCKLKDFDRAAPLASLRTAEPNLEAGWKLSVLANGQIEFALGDGQGSCDKFASPNFLRRNVTSFVAVVINEGQGVLYQDNLKTDVHGLTHAEVAASVLYVGQDPAMPWHKINGCIQCVSAFDRALTHEEIISIYQSGFDELTQEEQAE